MKEVVKKEILKLLDVGVIYPITDSKWVSPTQVVRKKSGVPVVANGNNELIPTRVTPPTRHRVSSKGVTFFFFKLITFTLAYSYNVKYLTCIILCSSGLQNINTSSINGSVQHLQYLHGFIKFHIQNRPKGLPVSTYGCVAFDC